MIVPPNIQFIKDLASALGVNAPVRRIIIDVACNDVVRVVVESIARNEDADKILELLSEDFVLMKKSEVRTPLGGDECQSNGTRPAGSET